MMKKTMIIATEERREYTAPQMEFIFIPVESGFCSSNEGYQYDEEQGW